MITHVIGSRRLFPQIRRKDALLWQKFESFSTRFYHPIKSIHTKRVLIQPIALGGAKGDLIQLITSPVDPPTFFFLHDSVRTFRRCLPNQNVSKIETSKGHSISDQVRLNDLLLFPDVAVSQTKEESFNAPNQTNQVAFNVVQSSEVQEIPKLTEENYKTAAMEWLELRQKALQHAEKQLQSLEEEKQCLDAAAEKRVYLKGLGIGTYLVVQYSIFAYGVWGVYSWDVMEPFCYFVGLSVTTASAFYYSAQKREATWSNLFQSMREKHRKSLYENAGFQEWKLTRLKEIVSLLSK